MSETDDSGKQKRPVMDAALQESLSFDHQRVSIIRCNATSLMFVAWFHVSCYFPVVTACLGPIGNTISIACVVEKWRFRRVIENGVETGTHSIGDPAGIFAFNVFSLVLGFVSNIVLLLHFGEKLSYLKAQWICIIGWSTASFMLLIDVIVCATKYMDLDHEKSIGFWYAVITSGLYFGCTITLATHYVGYVLGKYPARFNLIKNERSLMVFTVSFSVILIWGAGMFSGLLHISFGNGLYFCVVSILTIGLGDVLPISVAARILILVYSTLGVVNLALIIAMTTGIIRSSSGPVVFFHRVEVLRKKELLRIKNNEVFYTSKEAFNRMQEIRRVACAKHQLHAFLSTLLAFIVFWHLGSLGLKFAEDWSYFSGMYFCFLCLLTIGYGDYAPSSGAGRACFVIWALGAVPMMSAILSNFGDILLGFSDSIDLSIAKRFRLGLQSIVIHGSESWNKYILNDNEIVPEDDSDTEDYDDGNDDEENDNENNSEGNNHYFKDNSISSSKRNAFQELQSETAAPNSLNSKIHEIVEANPKEALSLFSHFHKCNLSGEGTPPTDSFEGTEFGELQRILGALKKFRSIAKQNQKYSLTFKQWNDLINLHVFSHSAEVFNDPNFWLSDYNPLRFPLNQPKFVVMRLFLKIEQMLTVVLLEEGRCNRTSTKTAVVTVQALRTREQEGSAKSRFQRVRSMTF